MLGSKANTTSYIISLLPCHHLETVPPDYRAALSSGCETLQFIHHTVNNSSVFLNPTWWQAVQ